MDKNYDVMTEHFTKHFVDHRGIGLAAQRGSELPLHHAKGAFHVRPLGTVGEKLIPLEQFNCSIVGIWGLAQA